MKRRLLVVEPDPPIRALLDRVLAASGYATEDFASAHDARVLLDEDAFDLALVDELAGGALPLDEVRFLRARFPRLPVVVTGTLLTAPVLLELLRAGVADALPKPFTPGELRASVSNALLRAAPRHAEALDFASALASAREALAWGNPSEAAPALARAWSLLPLDAEVTAMEALRAEVEGRDAEATRGWRAALALRDEQDGPPEPWEGLARLAAYGGARPVSALSERFQSAPWWLVEDPVTELTRPPPEGVEGPVVVCLTLSLTTEGRGAVYLRERADRAFAVFTQDLRPERAAPHLARLGTGPLVSRRSAPEDLTRLEALREEARSHPSPLSRASEKPTVA